MTAFCLSLIGRPGGNELSEDIVADVMNRLTVPGPPRWLARGEAAEVPFEAGQDSDVSEQTAALRRHFEGRPMDVAILPAAGRRKALLIADMDSTIIRQECIDEIADFAGLRDHISAITEKAMRGDLVFEQALEERVKLLKGLPANTLQRVIDERIELMPGARTLARTMRANGARTALISGGFTYFTSRVARMAGFQTDEANILEIENELLTGEVRRPIVGRDAKLKALKRLAKEAGLDLRQTLAVGDGANDLAMLKAAGLGVAFRAKPKVAAAARVRIDHGDLTALLYLQGYTSAEFRD